MAAPTINPSTAVLLVRKNLDEVGLNDSVMYGTAQDENSDNNSMDDIIAKNLPEAINEVHRAAPVALLDGIESASGSAGSPSEITATNFLRLVACKDAGTGIVLSEAFLESSVEARKQANPYIQGTSDRPRLIMCLGGDTSVTFKYYSAEGATTLYYVSIAVYTTTNPSYKYSTRLRQNIIDWLTAKVMETYNDARAQSYYTRALSFNI